MCDHFEWNDYSCMTFLHPNTSFAKYFFFFNSKINFQKYTIHFDDFWNFNDCLMKILNELNYLFFFGYFKNFSIIIYFKRIWNITVDSKIIRALAIILAIFLWFVLVDKHLKRKLRVLTRVYFYINRYICWERVLALTCH